MLNTAEKRPKASAMTAATDTPRRRLEPASAGRRKTIRATSGRTWITSAVTPRDDRQDRDVDPGGVHRLDAALADVLAPGLVVAHGVEGDAFVSRPALQAVERVADTGAVPVLFDRDDLHVDVLQ